MLLSLDIWGLCRSTVGEGLLCWLDIGSADIDPVHDSFPLGDVVSPCENAVGGFWFHLHLFYHIF